MTQLNLFDNLSNDAINPRLKGCSVGGSVSYRQQFGLDKPPKGTILSLKYMEGLKWYLHWENCQDGEDIVQARFNTSAKARKYASENGWLVSS